ncbi:MAG: flagellar M-ring protein FliF [Proteobacteria bacterium]|nr:flagellar M-ring protein FliF [Pseudomonadota bacterium]
MPQWLSNILAQWSALSRGRQIAFIASAAGSLAFFGWIAGGAHRAEHRLLYRGLEPQEASAVLEALAAERIPTRLEEGGSAIYVPAAQVHEARIRVAGRGLPAGGSTGFEIFDEGGFGVTDFIQKVKYRQALQGELARSVEQLEPVDKARVQIAIPERSAFVRRNVDRPSASVVVRLRPGHDLEAEQVRGVVHLVASSVEGLAATAVTVVDNRGRLLAPDGEGPPGPGAPASAMRQQQAVEKGLARQVESILEPAVGPGRVVARIQAQLDWTQSELTEESFDPDSQVARSEQRSSDTANEFDGDTGGVAGVRANAAEAVAAEPETGRERRTSRSSETINYEISKRVRREVAPVGRIRRLSVAVLIDGKPTPPVAAEEGAPPPDAEEFQPWDAESLARFEALAKRAVGFDAERGDELTLINSPFLNGEVIEEPTGFDPKWLPLVGTLLNYGGLLLALLLFAKLMLRPLVDVIGSGEARVVGMRARELDEGSLDPTALALSEGEREPPSLPDQVRALAEARGEDSVKTLRGWLEA